MHHEIVPSPGDLGSASAAEIAAESVITDSTCEVDSTSLRSGTNFEGEFLVLRDDGEAAFASEVLLTGVVATLPSTDTGEDCDAVSTDDVPLTGVVLPTTDTGEDDDVAADVSLAGDDDEAAPTWLAVDSSSRRSS